MRKKNVRVVLATGMSVHADHGLIDPKAAALAGPATSGPYVRIDPGTTDRRNAMNVRAARAPRVRATDPPAVAPDRTRSVANAVLSAMSARAVPVPDGRNVRQAARVAQHVAAKTGQSANGQEDGPPRPSVTVAGLMHHGPNVASVSVMPARNDTWGAVPIVPADEVNRRKRAVVMAASA